MTASAQGGGTHLVTGVTGSGNGMAVGGLTASNSSGFYAMPYGNGFATAQAYPAFIDYYALFGDNYYKA